MLTPLAHCLAVARSCRDAAAGPAYCRTVSQSQLGVLSWTPDTPRVVQTERVLKCTAQAAERAEGLRANPTTCSTVALLVGRVGRFALHTGVEVGRQRLDRR